MKTKNYIVLNNFIHTSYDGFAYTYDAWFMVVCGIVSDVNYDVYHSDHIGSSSFITDASGFTSQHLQYLPFGETFVEQQSGAAYNTPYKFSAKEKDEETGYSYFGARYYMPEILSSWGSVDPMSDKYPNISPYNYCHWNPIRLIDPDGMNDIEVEMLTQKDGSVKCNYMSNKGGKDVLIVNFSKEKANGDHIKTDDPIAINSPTKSSNSSSNQNNSTTSDRGSIISIANGTAAFGLGGTFDLGGVVDETGDAKMYLTIGFTTGIGVSASMGYNTTNKGFRTNQLAGEAVSVNASVKIPFLGKSISLDGYGDYKNGEWPGSNVRGGGVNVGVGAGYFKNHTFTILAPVPPKDFWGRFCRHF